MTIPARNVSLYVFRIPSTPFASFPNKKQWLTALLRLAPNPRSGYCWSESYFDKIVQMSFSASS